MAKRVKPSPVSEAVTAVRDEAILIPPGETIYTIDLDERTVEDLADGICSEALAVRMHELLRWRRDAYRALAREQQAAR